MKNSVVMATYNGEKYIIEQLDSIRNQTLTPDEVIICDDCSTDNTRKIIEDYIIKYNLAGWNLYINDVNIGFYDNFFKALRLCTGDIIYLSDQDDVWDINKIKLFSDQYKKKSELIMIQSNFKYIDGMGNEIGKQENYHNYCSGDFIELSIYDMCRFAGSGYTMSFKRSVLNKIFILHLECQKNVFQFHDVMLGLVAVSEGKCLLIRKVVDNHRIHETNVTKKREKSYTLGRTKNMQINLLIRRFYYFNIMANCTSDIKKRSVFLDFASFSLMRKMLIEKFQIKKFVYLAQKRKMYASKVGIIVDCFYSVGLEKVVCLFMK